MKDIDLTAAELMEIDKALKTVIERYEKDFIIFAGTPLAEVSRMNWMNAKSALQKITA